MNIFYFFKELDTPMYQWQRTNLIDELIRNGHKVAQLQISVAYFCSIGLYFLV